MYIACSKQSKFHNTIKLFFDVTYIMYASLFISRYLAKINTFQFIEEKHTKVGVSNLSDFRQVFIIKNAIFLHYYYLFIFSTEEIK